MRLKIAVLLLPFVLAPASAQFFDPFSAKEYTQLANHVELVNQIKHQLEIYAEMKRQGLQLTSVQRTAAFEDIKAVAAKAGMGVQFSVGGVEDLFRKTYPGYADGGIPYAKRYDKWVYAVLDTLYGATNAAAESGRQVQNEQSTIRNIQEEAMGTDTQQKALMMIPAVGAEQIHQTAKLRQAVLANMQAQNAAIGLAVQKDMAGQQLERQIYAPVGIRREGPEGERTGGSR